jgi:hypothetical protein
MKPVTIQVYSSLSPEHGRGGRAEPLAGTKVHVLGDGAAVLIEFDAKPRARADRKIGKHARGVAVPAVGQVFNTAKTHEARLRAFGGEPVEVRRVPDLIRPVARIDVALPILDAGKLNLINAVTDLEERAGRSRPHDDALAVRCIGYGDSV